ncbi:MAG: T9SS type A sorting domain-containing protein [Chryseobacterium sp.]|jgi:hypothetical protein|uniref:T9SS type A sorting domain-containing protein n=1 Tax=Chryseobacterium sp. TaxID=1871047 RepID=UPI0028229DA4|nr:T9SS type A sorting domain-containing protein [Chryseobacterium sp.]MDR2236899.1 T9SS type A sorting domain-containing protein [Chryseobacterium sp.]
MKTKQLSPMKSSITTALVLSAGLFSAQQWDINGNTATGYANYVGTTDHNALYLRTNGITTNPGQALLNQAGTFIVDATNNTNHSKGKGNIIAGAENILGNVNSSIVSGWGNNLADAGGANLVAGQSNIVTNNAGKSVALGWKNNIRDSNQFAIGVGVDLGTQYSGGFGVDLIATGTRSFVFGSGSGGPTKLTNNIPYSIMFGLSPTSTMLIRDQKVGVRTTDPTANFHSVGTVRLQGLPTGTGKALVVDSNGNVMIATTTLSKTAPNESEADLQIQIDDLKKEVQELKALLKQSKINVDLGMDSNEARLYQNVPNPAKGESTIQYFLPEKSDNASITFYSVSGQVVKTIPLKEKGNGNITVTGLQGGSYIYQMSVNGKNIDSKKMLVNN